MRYEKALAKIDADNAMTAEFVVECTDLREGIGSATLTVGEPLLYEQLLELSPHTARRRARRLGYSTSTWASS